MVWNISNISWSICQTERGSNIQLTRGPIGYHGLDFIDISKTTEPSVTVANQLINDPMAASDRSIVRSQSSPVSEQFVDHKERQRAEPSVTIIAEYRSTDGQTHSVIRAPT